MIVAGRGGRPFYFRSVGQVLKLDTAGLDIVDRKNTFSFAVFADSGPCLTNLSILMELLAGAGLSVDTFFLRDVRLEINRQLSAVKCVDRNINAVYVVPIIPTYT